MLFNNCAITFDKLERTSKRLEMMKILSDLFKITRNDEIKKLIYIIQGILAPPYLDLDLGLGERFAISAISSSSGYSPSKVESLFKKTGDLGECAEKLLSNKKQLSLYSKSLNLIYVYNSFVKIAKSFGSGSQDMKIKLLTELLNNATPLESKYIIRFVLGELRLGVGNPTILDALSFSKVGDKSLRDELERAFNVCSDLGLVSEVFFESPDKVIKFKVQPFKPLMSALAERLSNPDEIIKKLGKCAIEFKFDGMRLQCHKKGEVVEIYSRRLERITHMFPDLVNEIKSLDCKEIIFEGEALAFDKTHNKYLSFQETMHRRRKHKIGKMSEDFPLNLFVFDIMFFDGVDLTNEVYLKRREYLERIFPIGSLKISEKHIVESIEELESLFEQSVRGNLEGIMAKDLNAIYTAGKRKFAWIKLKKSYGSSVDTVDVVIVGYYLGKGSRSKFGFGGLLTAVYNPDSDRYETIAKIGTGFSEENMMDYEKLLHKIIIKNPPKNLEFKIEPDFWVKPKYVVEVAFDEISLSPTHTCGLNNGKGYALRFPRIIKLRLDKSYKEATSPKEIGNIYWFQFKKK